MQKWDLAYIDYQKGMKYKDIAAKYEVSINTVKSWKSRKWNAPPEKKGATKEEKVAHKKEVQPVIDNEDLTEQQKLFCLYYLECFNATKAYQKAYQCDYNSARSNSIRLIAKDSIKIELKRLKAELQQDIFLDVKDLIREYAKQAFADITDFVEFSSTEHKLYEYDDAGEKQEVFNEFTGELETYKSSQVSLKNSEEVDGTLIQEVKKGKDGVSVKLYDKQKAMAELMKYIEIDDLRNAQIEKAKADAEISQFKAEALKNGTTQTTEDKLDELLEKISGELND
ncbi:terminase [Enterococcus casseliflavus]|uniref:terminase small subunit n=1 Tax=Enterococcus casseliflavus TaxID=37734 RepID=UPI001C8B54D5|nr:terminase small subunit [Enterococcus casseliflavus]MBX9117244.1 terminase [Enterococcus casseliflavus]MBX9127710.1 terminase [Enterococcus casseliflavus]